MFTIVLLVVVSRLPTLAFPLLSLDEADIAVQTAMWMDGAIPYVDFVEHETLLIHSWYRAMFEMFGVYNMAAVHILVMLLVVATIAGIYLFARYVSGEQVARWAALLYAIFQSFYGSTASMAANTETLMNLFAIFGAYAFFKAMREDRGGMSLAAGALIGLSVMAERAGAAVVPACAVTMLWMWYRQRTHPWMRYAEEAFLLALGMVFPLALHMAYLTDVGGFDGFLRWGWAARADHLVPLAARIIRGLSRGAIFMGITWALWAVSGWAAAHFGRSKRWRAEMIFLVSWLGCAVIAVSLKGRFFLHDFLQLLPPLAVLAAIGVVSRWEFFLRSRRLSMRNRNALRAAAVLFVLVVPYAAFLMLHFREIGGIKVQNAPVRKIAAYISSVTEADERIFVWGNNSAVYFFSRRIPAGRFVDGSYLTAIPEGFEELDLDPRPESDLNAWVMLREDFARHPPALIVNLAPLDWRGYGDYPLFEQLFLANYVYDFYRRDAVIQGAEIYVRKRRNDAPKHY